MPEPSILCVTVGRGRHRHLIAEHKHLAEQGCKLVELRLDFLVTPPAQRQRMSNEEFARLYGASSQDIDKVTGSNGG